MLKITNLYSGYNGTDVLKDISLEARPGEITAVLGPNGCGKSTLLKTIARLLPYRGLITLNGTKVSSLSRKNLARKIAILSQSAGIYFPYTVYDTVALGRYPYSQSFLKNLSKEDEPIIQKVLDKLELTDVKERTIDELSGGQLQRVFLARTLVQNPALILLDEPTSHLDLKHQVEFLEYLTRWAKENNRVIIAVLHDLNLARRFADTAILIKTGVVVSSGKCEQVFSGKTLEEVYGLDIKTFMLDSLEKWRGTEQKKTPGETADLRTGF